MQRRLDLAVMTGYELRSLLTRYRMLQRMSRELGAIEVVDEQWQSNIDDIIAEMDLRSADEDGAPF